MKISRPETMSGKIRHLVSDSKNISLRNRGKVFPYKKCSYIFFSTHTQTENPVHILSVESKNGKFFVLSYVVALVLVFLKWAHLSLNSKRLSRYDATKLTRSGAFSRICIGNPVKFVPNFDLRTTFPAVWRSD